MEAAARGNERTRGDVLMILLLREIQRHGAVGFAVDELLHLGVRVVADFVGRSLR